MELDEKHALVQRLGNAMSDISEDCYYAGWMDGTEYFVPELCCRAIHAGRPCYWGHGSVTPEQALELVALAQRAGSWAALDDRGIGFVPFQPFPLPSEYIESIDREQPPNST